MTTAAASTLRLARLLPAMGLALVLASCAVLPVIPAKTTARTGSCPHLPAAAISQELSTTVHFSTGSAAGPAVNDGYCVFTGGSPSRPFHITLSGIPSSQVHGLLQDIALGYQSGTVVPSPSAVLLPHPGGSAIEGCSGPHCISIGSAGITLSPPVLESLLEKSLAALADAAPPTAQPTAAASPLPTPCTLISASEIQQATGWYVTGTTAPLPNECAFSNYDDTMSVIVTVSAATPSAFTLEKAAAPSPFPLTVPPAVAYGYVTTSNGVTVSRAVISLKGTEVRIVITTSESEQYALAALAKDAISALSSSTPSPSA